MNNYQPIDRDTLSAAVSGGRVAQQIVLSQFYGMISSVAWAAWPDDLKHLVDKEDLVQDIVVRIIEKLGTVDRDRLAEFPGWVAKVARSSVVTEERYWRAYKHGRLHITGDESGSDGPNLIERIRITQSLPEKPVRIKEAKQALLAAMPSLPEDQRDVIHRKYFLYESYKEIAEAMGKTEGAVRALHDRALANLEESIGTQSRWLSSR